MDEQRLRARLAALETAHMVHGFVADGHVGPMLEIATAFEEWLMRPGPIDVTGLDKAPQPSPHDVETLADRLGYERCDTFWRKPAGQVSTGT